MDGGGDRVLLEFIFNVVQGQDHWLCNPLAHNFNAIAVQIHSGNRQVISYEEKSVGRDPVVLRLAAQIERKKTLPSCKPKKQMKLF